MHTGDISERLASCALKLICSGSHVFHHDSRKFSRFAVSEALIDCEAEKNLNASVVGNG